VDEKAKWSSIGLYPTSAVLIGFHFFPKMEKKNTFHWMKTQFLVKLKKLRRKNLELILKPSSSRVES